jgi:EAL domain-containing protein (putative c-di-GMP-specific phosphodiesterase class I)/GGDEF domain-containing protein
MRLSKQIQIWLAIMLSVMLLFALKISLDCSSRFAAVQLSKSAENIADLLAISLSSQLSNLTKIEADIDRVFAGGQFKKIALIRLDGSVVYQRQADNTTISIPRFFEKYASVEFSKIESTIVDKDVIFGTIEMKLHPAPFYLALWTNFKKIGLVFFCLGIITILGSYFILNVLLSTLKQIQKQAEAISRNEYIINKKVPNTLELKQVSLAMNTMVAKVESSFNRHLEDIKYFKDLQFIDPITGLYNRKFLVKRLNHFLDSDTEKAYGHFFLLAILGMEQNNISTGHPAMQDFYKSLAGVLKNAILHLDQAEATRLSQQEFGIILPDCTSEDALAITKDAILKIVALIADRTELSNLIAVSGGLSDYNYQDDAGTVLSRTDYALSIAKNNPSGTIEIFKEKNDQPVMGRYQWQTMLHTALSKRRFFLTFQPVMSDMGELQREIYINLTDKDGAVHKAGFFMPMAISLGLASRIDKYVLEHAAEYLKNNLKRIVAVNISISFCKDRLAVVWLRHFLDNNQLIKERLFFEIHDIDLIQYPDVCIDLIRIIRQMGFGFGIDQCTLNDTSLNLLKEISPYYLKIEKEYFQDIESRGDTEVALKALLTLTTSLNIKLIVTKIEDKAFKEMLIPRKIKYFQGFGIADIQKL